MVRLLLVNTVYVYEMQLDLHYLYVNVIDNACVIL